MSAARLRQAADKVEHHIEFGNVTDPDFWTALNAWLRKEAQGWELYEASVGFAVKQLGAKATVSHSTHDEALAVADAILGGAA